MKKRQSSFVKQYTEDIETEIIFCPSMFRDIEEEIKNSKNPNPVSGHKYQQNIINGLLENGVNVSVINVPRIRPYPDYHRIIIKPSSFVLDGKQIGINIGFLNLPVISRVTKRISFRRELKKLLGKDKKILMTYNSYDIQSEEFQRQKKNNADIFTCDIVADMHGKYGIKNKTRGLKGWCIRRIEEKQDVLARLFDSYVLITKQMAQAIPVGNKPYTILEGMYDQSCPKAKTSAAENSKTNMVFYAGAVSLEYGIDHLLSAFRLIEFDDYILYIAGTGNAVDHVILAAEEDKRITYLGVLTPNTVEEYQKEATVLISPRKNDNEFVKYSFPSKTMECLASGTPYIAHRLSCEPEEYGEYIQYPRDESDIALKDEIIRVCTLPLSERNKIGKAGSDFIAYQKNPKEMCKRIITMLSENAHT